MSVCPSEWAPCFLHKAVELAAGIEGTASFILQMPLGGDSSKNMAGVVCVRGSSTQEDDAW